MEERTSRGFLISVLYGTHTHTHCNAEQRRQLEVLTSYILILSLAFPPSQIMLNLFSCHFPNTALADVPKIETSNGNIVLTATNGESVLSCAINFLVTKIIVKIMMMSRGNCTCQGSLITSSKQRSKKKKRGLRVLNHQSA